MASPDLKDIPPTAYRARPAVPPRRLTPMDAMFLTLESAETPMHVAGLLYFTPPPGAPEDFVAQLVARLKKTPVLGPPWTSKLRYPWFLAHPLQAWVDDPGFDRDLHIRHLALPKPGAERQLGAMIARLHSHPTDFSRPPWEISFIEGLEGGRFAIYARMHHALVDGFTAMRILVTSLGADAGTETELLAGLPSLARPKGRKKPKPVPADPAAARVVPAHVSEREAIVHGMVPIMDAMRAQMDITREVGHALMNVVRAVRGEKSPLVTPIQAPRSIINGRISRNRRFATQHYRTSRLRAVGAAAGGTLNDVILAICGGGLRRYLLAQSALPAAPLTAMIPVNIRPKGDPGGGNAVGAILASLGTDDADERARLEDVIASTRAAKSQLENLPRSGIVQYSAALMAPLGLQQLTGTAGRVRPNFNVIISNVPGPDHALYYMGARLDAAYPVSIPVHGTALNITIESYDGELCFGFIGCRDSLPHMQRLAVATGEALEALEVAYGLAPAPTLPPTVPTPDPAPAPALASTPTPAAAAAPAPAGSPPRAGGGSSPRRRKAP